LWGVAAQRAGHIEHAQGAELVLVLRAELRVSQSVRGLAVHVLRELRRSFGGHGLVEGEVQDARVRAGLGVTHQRCCLASAGESIDSQQSCGALYDLLLLRRDAHRLLLAGIVEKEKSAET